MTPSLQVRVKILDQNPEIKPFRYDLYQKLYYSLYKELPTGIETYTTLASKPVRKVKTCLQPLNLRPPCYLDH